MGSVAQPGNRPHSVFTIDESMTLHYAPKSINTLARLIGRSVSRALWFIKYNGLEHIPPPGETGFIVAANHQTYLDPVWIASPIAGHKFRFMAISTAFDWPLIGPLIKYLGSFPVSNDRRGAVRAYNESVATLQDGGVLFIFPEGERRHSDDRSFEFKTGAAKIAIAAGVPILPVTITGGDRVWPQGKRLPQLFSRVTVTYHPRIQPPIEPIRSNVDVAAKQLTDELAAVINAYQSVT